MTGGGLARFIKDSINWERRYDLENDDVEGMWVEVFIKNTRSFLIRVYYTPPDTSDHLLTNFNGVIGETLRENVREGKDITIMGIF